VLDSRAAIPSTVSAHYPDKRDWKREVLLQGHVSYLGEWPWVRAWLRGLRLAATPGDYFDLHRTLLNRTYTWQKHDSGCRAQVQDLRAEVKAAKAASANPDQLRALSEQIELARRDREAALAILGILRMLGDALVWRVLRYERPIITVLGAGRAVGRLAEGRGLSTELAEIGYLWQENRTFALLADLTNCVRHGDVLSIESWEPLVVRLTESKTSGRGPAPKQAARLEQATRIINDGFHPSAVDGSSLYLQRPRIRYETHHARLVQLIATARGATHAVTEVEPGVVVEVYDEANPARLSSEVRNDLHEQVRAQLGWEEDNDVISYSASSRRLRDRHADHTFASLAPLALLPLALDDITDLVFGRLDFITTVHAPSLEAQLAARGIEARVARSREAAGESFLTAERDSSQITVPATVREQVQLELLRLGTLFAAVDWFLTETKQRGSARPNVALRYDDERTIWEAYPEGELAA
jgi:hypothetical protein